MALKNNMGRMYRRMDRMPYTYIYSKNRRITWSHERKLKVHDQGAKLFTDLPYVVVLRARTRGVVVEASVEAARVAVYRALTKNFGKLGFSLRVLRRAHHLCRHHKLGTQAGADRLSSGMRQSFSPVYARAVRLEENDGLFQVRIAHENQLALVKQLLTKKCGVRLPLDKYISWSKT